MSDKGLKACPRNDFNTKTKEDAYGNDIWGGKGVNPDYVIFLEEHYSPEPKPDWISVGSAAQFFIKVNDVGDCWEWTGAKNKTGYGVYRIGKKTILAHRYSYIIANNREPDNLVLHKCNNPICVNPYHLYDGSHRDNMLDLRKTGFRRKNLASKHVGVRWRSDSKKWVATFRGKSQGCFNTEDEAGSAYDRAAVAHYGEGIPLNVPEPPKTRSEG